jgi:hypothetical protein
MRWPSLARLALAAALLITVGCSSENKGQLEDTDWLSQAATVQGEALPAGARQLQFKPDGHLIYRIGPKVYQGSYALGIGPAVTFHLEEELDGRKIHAQKIIRNGNQLTLTNPDGSELTFQLLPKQG